MTVHIDTETENETEGRTLHVTFESREQFTQRGLEQMEQIDDGRREPFEPTHVLSFSNFEDFAATFSAKNLELLEIIAEHDPESIRETARIVERGTKEVHRNLTELAELGVIEFENHGQAKRPTVFYDEIEVTVPLPRSNETNGETATPES